MKVIPIKTCRFQTRFLFLIILFCGMAPMNRLLNPVWADTGQPAGQPDENSRIFGQSRLIPSTDRLTEGEVISYVLAVQYDGDEASKPVTVVFRIPFSAMMVFSSPPSQTDDDQRELIWKEEFDPGMTREFAITLVTLPDSAGSGLLIASAGILWRRQGMEWQTDSFWLQNETAIHSKPEPAGVTFPNSVTLEKPVIVLLGYLILGTLLVLLLPAAIFRRAKQRQGTEHTGEAPSMLFLYPATLMLVFLLGIAHLMGAIAFEDIRRFTAYEKTSCILLDKRIFLTAGQSSTRGRGQTGSAHRPTLNEPMVAVRYQAGGRDIIAVGPPRPTSLLSPVDRVALRELARYERNQRYPCWYDPKKPQNFVLKRGISLGWYLLGAGPLILLYFLARYFYRQLRNGSDFSGSANQTSPPQK